MPDYLARDPDRDPATVDEVAARWRTVEALQTAMQHVAACLVKARVSGAGQTVDGQKDIGAHEAVLTFLADKLVTANLAYYEADHSREQEYQRRKAAGAYNHPHDHGHDHTH